MTPEELEQRRDWEYAMRQRCAQSAALWVDRCMIGWFSDRPDLAEVVARVARDAVLATPLTPGVL